MLFKLLTTYTKMISIPNKVPRKKRVFLGPLSRKILKLSNWEITGEFPNYKKIILIGVPHTANRDAWYALLAVLALDLKINFFGARWIFTRLPSPYTFSKDVDRLGIPWPLGWLQKIILLKLGGIPVYRNKSKGLIKGAIEEFSKMEEYVLAIAPEAGTEQVKKFRSGFYYLAKELDIPYLPIELDFKNRRFHVQKEQFVCMSFEEESKKIISLFEGVEGALREFKMPEETEQKD